ncbi:MAG: mechanosensitive ion channel family protein [Sumerlaeia bacterium]
MLEEVQTFIATRGVEFGIKILTFLVIIVVAKLVIGLIMKATTPLITKQERLPVLLRNFVAGVVSKLLWIMAILVGLETVGISVMPFIMGLGVAGFILGFAFQETLSNLAAGVMILIHNPFDKGQFVDAGGVTGSVTEINLASTVLTTPDNKRVVIPNSKVWGQTITNFTVNPTRRVDLTVGVSYESDLNKVRQVITEVLDKNKDLILEDPKPQIELMAMADSSLNFVVRPWTKTTDYWTLFFKLNQEIKESLDANGISIPFPQRDLHIKGLPEAFAKQISENKAE